MARLSAATVSEILVHAERHGWDVAIGLAFPAICRLYTSEPVTVRWQELGENVNGHVYGDLDGYHIVARPPGPGRTVADALGTLFHELGHIVAGDVPRAAAPPDWVHGRQVDGDDIYARVTARRANAFRRAANAEQEDREHRAYAFADREVERWRQLR